jgi:hypothetical protein
LQGQETILTCPNLWKPQSQADISSSIIVHAYDFMADNIVRKYDARNDRHVGRLDLLPDIFVRDWTINAVSHDDGLEPSTQPAFYVDSDVWNRRSLTAGPFIDDKPQNQLPRQGIGSDGDNFIFARVSRNSSAYEQTVRAHFMVAEFGTGSPFTDCSPLPDPSVVFLPGETTKIVSLPWRLHPTSSTHLCLAVQVYTEADPYVAPGLLGRTPGWPVTDMMVIDDNNKAQRNMTVWDGMADFGGTYFGRVNNGATFIRDMELSISFRGDGKKAFNSAKLSVVASEQSIELQEPTELVLHSMLPGESRYLGFSFGSLNFQREQIPGIRVDEIVDGLVVNGFAIDVRPVVVNEMLASIVGRQASSFFRMAKGMGLREAGNGYEICQRLLKENISRSSYGEALPQISEILSKSLVQMRSLFPDVKDVFGLSDTIEMLGNSDRLDLGSKIGMHDRFLHQLDVLQTQAFKSKGDNAGYLFNMRLQIEVYKSEKLLELVGPDFTKPILEFIETFPSGDSSADDYRKLVAASSVGFKLTAKALGQGALAARYKDLEESLSIDSLSTQKAHLNFLNAVLLSLSRK